MYHSQHLVGQELLSSFLILLSDVPSHLPHVLLLFIIWVVEIKQILYLTGMFHFHHVFYIDSTTLQRKIYLFTALHIFNDLIVTHIIPSAHKQWWMQVRLAEFIKKLHAKLKWCAHYVIHYTNSSLECKTFATRWLVAAFLCTVVLSSTPILPLQLYFYLQCQTAEQWPYLTSRLTPKYISDLFVQNGGKTHFQSCSLGVWMSSARGQSNKAWPQMPKSSL